MAVRAELTRITYIFVWVGLLHRLSSFKAGINPEYPSHITVPSHMEGPGEAGGSVK